MAIIKVTLRLPTQQQAIKHFGCLTSLTSNENNIKKSLRNSFRKFMLLVEFF